MQITTNFQLKTIRIYYLTVNNFCRLGVQWALLGFAQDITKPKSVSVRLSSFQEVLEKSISMLIEVIGWIQFLVVLGLRSPVSCWLLVRSLSLSSFRLFAFLLTWPSSSSHPAMAHGAFLMLWISLTYPFACFFFHFLPPAGEIFLLFRTHVIRLGSLSSYLPPITSQF